MIFEDKGGDVYYEVHGPQNAPVVAFTHGVTMDQGTFAHQVEAVKDNYRALVWDMPGHGRSDQLKNGFSYSQAAECLVGLLDEIEAEKAVLVGLSMGGHIGQYCAYHYPERAKANVEIGSTALHKGLSRLSSGFGRLYLSLSGLIPPGLFYRWFAHSRARQPSTRQYLQESARRMGKAQILHISRSMFADMTAGIPNAPETPLLITYGEHEQGFVIKHIQNWHKETPGSQCEVIPNAGHIANQDNPQAFNRVLLSFLEGIYSSESKPESLAEPILQR
jgi:3-oxoadipate enol-lactonase